VLLLLGGASDGWLASLPGYSAGNLDAYRIVSPGMAAGDLIDSQGTVAARFGSTPAAYLIRPDGYVGFRCGQRELPATLPCYLDRLFGSAPTGSA
jgi:hypothetical protein